MEVGRLVGVWARMEVAVARSEEGASLGRRAAARERMGRRLRRAVEVRKARIVDRLHRGRWSCAVALLDRMSGLALPNFIVEADYAFFYPLRLLFIILLHMKIYSVHCSFPAFEAPWFGQRRSDYLLKRQSPRREQRSRCQSSRFLGKAQMQIRSWLGHVGYSRGKYNRSTSTSRFTCSVIVRSAARIF